VNRSLVVLAVLLALTPARAAEWPQWRGPIHNGATPDDTPLPTDFGPAKHVLWSTEMPGASPATPAIRGEHVFAVSTDENRTTLHGLCLDRETGEILWRKALVNDAEPNARNAMAACSPVADDERVYFLFGSSDLFALDLEGNTVWSADLEAEYGPVRLWWGYSSSPLLFDDKLYVPVLTGRDTPSGRTDEGSYVICFDPPTGKVLWRRHRPPVTGPPLSSPVATISPGTTPRRARNYGDTATTRRGLAIGA